MFICPWFQAQIPERNQVEGEGSRVLVNLYPVPTSSFENIWNDISHGLRHGSRIVQIITVIG